MKYLLSCNIQPIHWGYAIGILPFGFLYVREAFHNFLMKNPVSTHAQRKTDFLLDSRAYTVTFGQRSQKFTRIEYKLLEYLMCHQGYLVLRQDLLDAVWGPLVSVEPRTVDSHIVRLRRKLNMLGPYVLSIETVWGLGYRFRWLQQE